MIKQTNIAFSNMLNIHCISCLALGKQTLTKMWAADYWRECMITANLCQFVAGEGIQRPLDTIVKCAKRIYDTANYKGKLVWLAVNIYPILEYS